MSDERSISVAELLARGGSATPAAGGRRRRHRGGENSISVAELTGEIPVIRDDTPAPSVPSAPEVAVPVASEVPDASEVPVAEAPVEEAAEVPEAAEAVVVEESDEDSPITSSFLAAAVEDTRAEDAVAEDAAAEGVVDEEVAEVDVAEGTVDEVELAEVADADGQVEHHTNEGHAQANYAWSKWDQAEAPIMATADFNTAQVRERQARFAEAEPEDTVDVAPVTEAAEDEVASSVPDTASMSVQQIDAARAALDAQDAVVDVAETDTDVETDTDIDDDGIDEDEPAGRGQGWLALIAEVVLGVAAGAGLFFGFFKLWNWGGGNWTIALTVVLAFMVIIAIVTFTHYLRKSTDYLTLALALLVGLVITFGPLLMVLGSN